MSLMDMVDVDMEAVKKRKSCEERLKQLDDKWKAKMTELLRDQKKRTIEMCNEQIRKVIVFKNEKLRETIKECNNKLEAMRRKCNVRIRALDQENKRLKAENAELADAVARTAAAMTLSGMPGKRRRPGFIDLGNPLMW